MRTLTETEFLVWAEAQGIRADGPSYLSVFGEDSYVRGWGAPSECFSRTFFLSTLLDLLGDWEACYVWRHMAPWPGPVQGDSRDALEVVEARILAGLSVPPDSSDILEFGRDEYASVLTLMFCSLHFGWCVVQDILVVPDHARQVLLVSHHEVVDVCFRSLADADQWSAVTQKLGLGVGEEYKYGGSQSS